VLLCGVFFTLGYVMGRTQYGGSVHAADSPIKSISPAAAPSSKAKNADTPAPPSSSEWDFYNKKDENHLEPIPKPSSPTPSRASNSEPKETAPAVKAAAKPNGRFQPPAIPKGAILLQLGALTRQSDALDLADAAQQKRFSAFVVAPSSDNLYRVQVGPYRDLPSAEAAQKALEQAGFKAIIKR
jgi:cell division septation protein DedD